MREAVRGDRTTGFEAVIADLPEAVAKGRGERWVEGVFGLTRATQGNGVGYDTICAAGDHATHAALDPERRRRRATATCCCSTPASRSTPSTPPTSPARCRSNGTFTDAQREVYEAVLRRAGGRHRRGQAGQQVPRRARRRDAGHRRAPAEWGLLPEGVASRRRSTGARPVPPPLDGARHQPPPRPRRARLRAGPPRGVHGRRARAGHGPHRRARAVLPGRRPHRARASSAASACGSRTTCWSPRTATRTCRPRCRAPRRRRGVDGRRLEARGAPRGVRHPGTRRRPRPQAAGADVSSASWRLRLRR